MYHLLALFKIAFTKYLIAQKVTYHKDKSDVKKINVNEQIIEIYEKGEKTIIIKAFKFLNRFVKEQVEVVDNEKKTAERMLNFLFSSPHYQRIYGALKDTEISLQDIEDIVLEDDEELIAGDKEITDEQE